MLSETNKSRFTNYFKYGTPPKESTSIFWLVTFVWENFKLIRCWKYCRLREISIWYAHEYTLSTYTCLIYFLPRILRFKILAYKRYFTIITTVYHPKNYLCRLSFDNKPQKLQKIMYVRFHMFYLGFRVHYKGVTEYLKCLQNYFRWMDLFQTSSEHELRT